MGDIHACLDAILARALDARSAAWLAEARSEIAAGASDDRFVALLSLASRYMRRRALRPSGEQVAQAGAALAGWNPERWSLLEAVRARLVLACPDPQRPAFVARIEEAFRFADEGEACALYRSIALLPDGERFVWRAAEGCRSNMRSVFEAIACDNPYPVDHFDDVAWRQLVIKSVFIGAPTWRVFGLDSRLSSELARMALDLADERRSAGRAVQKELWLCLGPHAGERGLRSLELELARGGSAERRAAVLALARAGARERLEALQEQGADPEIADALAAALRGNADAVAFAAATGIASAA